jgi:hypothetical protein
MFLTSRDTMLSHRQDERRRCKIGDGSCWIVLGALYEPRLRPSVNTTYVGLCLYQYGKSTKWIWTAGAPIVKLTGLRNL